jgi:hypothetical protein
VCVRDRGDDREAESGAVRIASSIGAAESLEGVVSVR